jgi:serine/threonine-protein kinase
MADDPRVQHLLDELLDSHATPEQVCEPYPELLPVVRARWEQVCRLQADLDVMFPPSGDPPPPPDGEALPRVPGYEVEGVLGRGGMGVVFRARHLRLDRLVAVKMMLAGAYAGPRERARFQREAEAVARLRHPNVVQVYDVGEADGRPYFTMEYVEGGSLARKLAGTPQPAEQAAQLVATLAGAVQAAHAAGIVHRDLKPANVLLTAEGTPNCPTPKIADFGLARRFDGEEGPTVTLEGARVGTASYMAPEQALGVAAAPAGLCPRVDVYALGAILYECLTGRPPFKGATALETVQQVLDQDPVAPSQLNARVPRDLETVCLKCLHKDPRARYPTAADLEDDLARFLRGEAVAARPEGWVRRLVRRVRRRPALSAAVAGVVVLAVALAGSALWVRWEKSQRERAKVQLERLDQDRRDQQLAARLDAIRLNRSTVVESLADVRSVKAQADRDYESAFREAGFGQVDDDPNGVGARVADSNIRKALVTALDDWAVCVADERRYRWVMAVARRADPDASDWRWRARDPKNWRNPAALAELAREARIADESVVLLVSLGNELRAAGQDATPFLRAVRQAHPTDYWTNDSLGFALQKTNPAESIRYYQVAEALRPGEFLPVGNLGCALLLNGQVDEAIACFRRVVDLAPADAKGHAYLGRALARKGRHDEAVRELQRAVDLNPNSAFSRTQLSQSLLDLDRVDDAIAEAREAVRIDPDYAFGQNVLGMALFTRRPSMEALGHVREAVRLDPDFASAHSNLGTILRSAGRPDDAVKHAEQAVRLEPNIANFHFNLANNLKAANRRNEAVARYEHALRLDPALGPAHHGLGVMLAEDRRLDEAIGRFQQAIGLDPANARAHAALGEALIGRGRLTEAAAALGRCVELFPRGAPERAAAEQHLAHCKELIALDGRLAAVLAGDDGPEDATDCLLFAKLCRAKERYAAAARFSADAFIREPGLAENLRTRERYDAARAAALAGCGLGGDAAALGDAERSRWRTRARAWLRSDLAAWGKRANGTAADRLVVQRNLARWRVDPDLAGLREPVALGVLAEDERKECLALWAEVAAVLARTK